MDFNEGINAILKGNAIIFLGAGFSRENKNINGCNLPLAQELSESLQKLSGVDEDSLDSNLSIQIVSEYYISTNGKSKLVDLLKKNFTVFESMKWQQIIAVQDWKRIYTTNYDNVFEIASNEVRKHRVPIDISEGKSYGRNISNQVIHLNGYIDSINENNLSDSTKLTSESYTDTYFIDGPWRNEFEIDIDHAQAIFFIGFSLDYDLDLKRIIYSNKQNREKIYFINGKNLSIIKSVSLGKYGQVIDMDAKDFSKALERAKKEYQPIENETITTLSLQKSCLEGNRDIISDKDVSDLFFNGEVNKEKIYSSINEAQYIVKRTKVDEIIKEIKNYKGALIQGKLGNGKSIFLKSVECELVKKGYTVYVYNGNPNDLLEDIEKIKNADEITIVIIDDFYSLKSQFKYFSRLNNSNIKFIISGRTYVNENNFLDFLKKAQINDNEIISFNMDEIDEYELKHAYNLIENHNLWGKMSSYNSKKKKGVLKRISKNGFKNIALEIVKSNNIVTKINAEYSKLNDAQKNLILGILINNLLRTHLSISQIGTLTKTKKLNLNETENANFKEFVDIDNNRIIIQSAIAAIEIMNSERDKKRITNVMETMFRQADRIDETKTYEYLKRELVSFSNFKLIIGNKVEASILDELALSYFENIRNVKFAKENPFFWLQYGIQRLNAKEYQMADKFFDNALGLADKKGFSDFYQINAQKARGLIEEVVEDKVDVSLAYPSFEKAHDLLINDLEKITNNKSYQLSQGPLYELFYTNYYKFLSEDQKINFNFRANQFNRNVQNYIDELVNRHMSVPYKLQQSRNSLKRLI